MQTKTLALALGLGILGAALALPVAAQVFVTGGSGGGWVAAPGDTTQPGPGRGGFGPGGMQFDMTKILQQMQDQLKADLGATDDEWKILLPKIEKVQGLQMAAAMSRFGGGRGMMLGGPARPADPVSDAAADLRNTAANKDATDAQLKEKLAAFRAAQAKAKEDLTKAQNDLRDLLTVRQEVVLVARGILD